MKKSTLLLIVFFLSFNLFAQEINHTAKGLSFQGIARDDSGNVITDGSVTVVFKIGSWTETKEIAVDGFGVFSHIIGSVENTTFQELDFSKYDYNFTVEVQSNEIYNGKLNSVPYAKAAGNGVPVGSIMPFAGTVSSGASFEEVVPGWLICNGATIPGDTKYDKLKNVLGSSWGSGVLPDLRGVFLRGINNGRTGTYSDSDTRDVGGFQDDTFKSHDHEITDPGHNHSYSDKSHSSEESGWDGTKLYVASNQNPVYTNRVTQNSDTNITIDNEGGAETRPVNAGVNFIIKY